MNMTAMEAAPPVAPEQMRRRVDDLPLPGQPLDWGDEGTPFESTNVVYLYRPRAERFPRWAEIRTQEHLLDVKKEPSRFEIWTLFRVSVDDLARAPVSTIALAQTRLDRIERAAGAAIANMRTAMREFGDQS